jgi:hypothetical protein
MMPILHHLWPSIALAGMLGIVFGWLGPGGGPMSRTGRLAATAAALCLIVAAGVAVLGSIEGRPGFWFESAVLHAFAYLVGSCLGWGAASLARRSPSGETGSAR